jgi:hypothetical protein
MVGVVSKFIHRDHTKKTPALLQASTHDPKERDRIREMLKDMAAEKDVVFLA